MKKILRVWLWHGKKRGLVPRRTALRQAESLKGHGYQAGNAIVGRGIQSIVEIDERKVGQVEDDTKLNEEFMALLNRPYRQLNDFLFVPGSESEESEAPKPKMAAPKVEAPKAKPAAISKPAAAKPAPPPQAGTPLKAATARPGPLPKPSPPSKPAVTKPAASSRLAAPSVSKDPIKFAPKPAPKAEEEPGAETEEELVPKEVEEPVESEPETVPTEEIEKPMPSKVMKKGQSNDLAKTGLFIMAVMEKL